MVATAQVWNGGSAFELKELAFPELKDGELLVRLTGATVCGSDRHTVQGRRSSPSPSVLGHEGVGEVVVSKRAGLETGQRVVFSVVSSCGECARCRSGLTAKCLSVQKVGHESLRGPWPLSGTYATHIHLLAGQTVIPVAQEVPDVAASVASCAVATVMSAFEAADEIEGRTVLINGIGMLGLVALSEAERRRAGRIIGCDINGNSFHLAEASADELVNDPSGIQADVVFDFSGVSEGVSGALSTLNVGGTAVLAGSVAPSPNVALDPEWVVRGWRTVTGVHNYEPRHLAQAVDFVENTGARIGWDAVAGPPISLAELPGELVSKNLFLRRLVIPAA